MRHLYLLRHAEAARPPNTDDKLRPLTAKGIADARSLGKVMVAKNYIPDFIICSPARRAQQTLRRVTEALGTIPTVSPPDVYYSTTGQLFEEVRKCDITHQKILMISHNPSIHSLARSLSGISLDGSMMRLIGEYRECTLSVFNCPIEDWANLALGQNDLDDLLVAGEDFGGTKG